MVISFDSKFKPNPESFQIVPFFSYQIWYHTKNSNTSKTPISNQNCHFAGVFSKIVNFNQNFDLNMGIIEWKSSFSNSKGNFWHNRSKFCIKKFLSLSKFLDRKRIILSENDYFRRKLIDFSFKNAYFWWNIIIFDKNRAFVELEMSIFCIKRSIFEQSWFSGYSWVYYHDF